MFVGILLRDPARDFGVEFESLRHREIFEISMRADKKTIGSHLKLASLNTVLPIDKHKAKKKTLSKAVNNGCLTPLSKMVQIGV